MIRLSHSIVLILTVNLHCVLTNDLRGFDDNIYFSLNWKGNDNLLVRKKMIMLHINDFVIVGCSGKC